MPLNAVQQSLTTENFAIQAEYIPKLQRKKDEMAYEVRAIETPFYSNGMDIFLMV